MDNNLVAYIKGLPVDPATQTQLLVQLESGDEAGVKVAIAELLAAAQENADLTAADEEFQQELAETEQEAKAITGSIAKDIDENEMEEARSAIANS